MPKVYDKNGNELTVGARVKDGLNSDFTGTFLGTRKLKSGPVRAEVRVLTPLRHAGKQITYAPASDGTCDLLLIDSPTEGKEG